ncbi:aldo/keto reductase [Streptomyces sp. NPDC020917]|uniref:aldo/keto reductase n=1 Tax=Streptomyces sp. NPDC020917 TaxID=3365102 RepID=UPI00378A67FA
MHVTEFGFGAASLGNLYTRVDDETARGAVDAAYDGGVRYFDTAPHYGLGLSERRLGAALADRPRDDYVVSTKVGRLLLPNHAPTGSDLAAGGFDVTDELTRVHDYSRDGVRRSLDASLTRLGLDRVDILYVHDPEEHLDQAVTEAIPALIALRDQGVIGAIGVGMNFWQPLLRVVTETDVDVVMLAGRWTLADRTGAPLLAACRQRGVSVVAAAPFNSGLLSRAWPPNDAYFDYGPASADVLAHARRLAAICREHGTTLPHAAMRFPLRDPAAACVVAGVRTPLEAQADCAWMTTEVPARLWDHLDAP